MKGGPRSVWLAAMMTVVLAGCAQTEVPAERFYRLDPGPPPQSFEAPPLEGTLIVRRFLADGLIRERPLVYSEGTTSGELRQYHYHVWAEPPDRMLQDLLVGYLRAAHLARRVINPELVASPSDYALVGKLKRLEQWRGQDPHVVVEVELGLNRLRDGTLLWIEDYRAEVAAADDSIASSIAAYNEALGDIYARFLADLPTG